ncbi:MAG: hypothetical protein ACM3UW_04030 [Bacillota bacterium]
MSHEYFTTMAIPVINGLAEVAKRAGLSNRYVPLLAILLGLLAGIGLRNPEESIAIAVMEGLVIGLSAVGLYSGTRHVLGKTSSGKGNGKNDINVT